MTDYIDRQVAIDEFGGVKVDEENCTEYDIGYNDGIDFAVSRLSVLPSVDAVEVRHGRWIEKGNGIATCSVCGGEPYYSGNIYAYKYCPYCGARMDGEA